MYYMTQGEICREYRLAKDKPGQIIILAELNLCSWQEIAEILAAAGEEVKMRKRGGGRRKLRTAEDIVAELERIDNKIRAVEHLGGDDSLRVLEERYRKLAARLIGCDRMEARA